MTTIHIHAETPVPPGPILAALTDFTDRRLEYWPILGRRQVQNGRRRRGACPGGAMSVLRSLAYPIPGWRGDAGHSARRAW